MALVDEEERRRAERAHQVALFRYQLIREAADAALSPRQRGAMVRAVAARILPGARYRRHLLWRYSVTWVKPA